MDGLLNGRGQVIAKSGCGSFAGWAQKGLDGP
jgi:hypothetical protein